MVPFRVISFFAFFLLAIARVSSRALRGLPLGNPYVDTAAAYVNETSPTNKSAGLLQQGWYWAKTAKVSSAIQKVEKWPAIPTPIHTNCGRGGNGWVRETDAVELSQLILDEPALEGHVWRLDPGPRRCTVVAWNRMRTVAMWLCNDSQHPLHVPCDYAAFYIEDIVAKCRDGKGNVRGQEFDRAKYNVYVAAWCGEESGCADE